MRAAALALLLAGVATQAHPAFSAAYSGKNSRGTAAESATSVVVDPRGYGFLIGDGALTHTPEIIAEIYYRVALTEQVSLGVNYQPVPHPAYNQDRGPVHVFTARAHVAF